MEDEIFLMTETGLQNLMTRKEDFKRNPDIFLKANEPLSYSFNGYQSLQEKKSDYYYLKIQSDGTAVANIFGSLDKNPDSFDERYYGVINLTKLLADVEKAKTDDKVKKMVFVYDSPGGTVSGTPEVAKAIYDFGKPNYGYITGQCCSGALWLAVNHNNIYASSGLTNYIGSVGVVTMHIDKSKFYEEYGYKISLVTNKKSPHKTDGNSFEPLSEQARTEIVKKADGIYEAFVETIKKNYPDTPEEFLDGRVFSATDAKNFGIIKNIVEQKKLFIMSSTEGSNPNTAAASNLSPTAQNGGNPVSANADSAVLALLTEIKTSIGSLETKIEAKVDEKLSAFEERFQAIEAKIGLKPKISKVIAMVEDEEGFKAELPKKQEYRAVNTLPQYDFKQNKLSMVMSAIQNKVRDGEQYQKIAAVANKVLATKPFDVEFYSANAFDPSKFQQVMGDFQELYQFEWQDSLLDYGTFSTLRGFMGVVNEIVLGKFFAGSLLSPVAESRRDIELIKTDARVLKVEIVAGRVMMNFAQIRQGAMSYVSKPKNNDPYYLDAFWQYAIMKSLYVAARKDLENIVWLGQKGKYPVTDPKLANPLNATDGLLAKIAKDLLTPTPNVNVHVTGTLTIANIYTKVREMLEGVHDDVMRSAVDSEYGALYMSSKTFNMYKEAVKNEFKSTIFYDSYNNAFVYGYEFIKIKTMPYIPDGALIFDPLGVMCWGTNTDADITNVKVEPSLGDLFFLLFTCIGAEIADFYLGDPANMVHLLHVNDIDLITLIP